MSVGSECRQRRGWRLPSHSKGRAVSLLVRAEVSTCIVIVKGESIAAGVRRSPPVEVWRERAIMFRVEEVDERSQCLFVRLFLVKSAMIAVM